MPPTTSDTREPRKRKPSEKLASLDNADKDAVKRRRMLQAANASDRSRQPSVEDVEDDSDGNNITSLRPKNPRNILELSDGSDDEVIELDRNPSQSTTPGSQQADDGDEEEQWEDEDVVDGPTEMTDEQELAKLKKEWRSPIYAFFRPEVDIRRVDGRPTHEFKCGAAHCKHRKGRVVRRYLDTGDKKSTSNLRRHAKQCWGEEVVRKADECGDVDVARGGLKTATLKDGSITAVFERNGKGKISYSHRQHTRTETRAEIVKWVAKSMRPFSIVEDEGFRMLMKTGRPDYYIPSRVTVARDVKQVFKQTKKRISKMLQDHDGSLSFGTDAWTSPNNKAFVAVTVHFEQNGIPMSLLLDLVELACSHSGVNLATAFASILEDFGIGDKILSVTCDNASCNDTMIDELAKLLEAFPGAANRTRCFAHILNLVARCILKQFDMPKADWTDDETMRALAELAQNIDREGEEMDEGGGEADSEEGLLDMRAEMSEEAIKELEETVRPVRVVLVKVSGSNFEQATSAILMPRDVTTRWNSTYNMLDFAYEYRAAINTITANRDMKLRAYELSDADWAIVKDLRDLLKIFKDATLFFSRATPNLAKVIPAMDHIDQVLATAAAGNKYLPSIQAAAALGKAHLNKYYNMTDTTEVYRIAMILHPAHKTTYFKLAGWEEDWIETAEEIIRAEFNRAYSELEIEVSDNLPIASSVRTSAPANIFDNLPAVSSEVQAQSTVADELDRYLKAPTEAAPNPLLWWHEKRAVYPRLSRMALDYLSIPATSVDVERVFSKGRLVLSHVRNRLSVESTRALMCLGAWSRLDLIRSEDILDAARCPDVKSGTETAGEDEVYREWDV